MPNSLHFFSTIPLRNFSPQFSWFCKQGCKRGLDSVCYQDRMHLHCPLAAHQAWHTGYLKYYSLWASVSPSYIVSPKSPSQSLRLVSLLGVNRKMSTAMWVCLGCGHLPIYNFVLRGLILNRPLISVITLKLRQTQERAFFINSCGLYVMYRFP